MERVKCDHCGAVVDHVFHKCPYCKKTLTGDFVQIPHRIPEYNDEPMFYECSMCGMEIIDYETVRGHKYCRSCAAIERHG